MNIHKKIYRRAIALLFQLKQKFFMKSLHKNGDDKIIFIVPNGDIITGGIMSILNIFHITERTFPDKKIFIAISDNVQRFTKYTHLESNTRILNFNIFAKDWLENNSNILIHVWDGGSAAFFQEMESLGLIDKFDNVIINILNQNQDLMPKSEELFKYSKTVKSMTMTLAFKENSNNNYPYLNIKPKFVGALIGNIETNQIRFKDKDNLCIISPDKNPHKDAIIKKLLNRGIECFQNYPIPFHKFIELQKRAKWTISFGEGWDGYTSYQFRNGGIGFGVYQKQFSQSYFDEHNLPPFLFKSYDEMENEIISKIEMYDNEDIYNKTNDEIIEIMDSDSDRSTPERVEQWWREYYHEIGYLN